MFVPLIPLKALRQSPSLRASAADEAVLVRRTPEMWAAGGCAAGVITGVPERHHFPKMCLRVGK